MPVRVDRSGRERKKFDAPVPLSEFAKRQKSHTSHTGHGRRDQLTAGERTRILRMLRDEGGRMADEESQVFVGVPPAPRFDMDFEDSPAPPPSQQMPVQRPEVNAKPAVVVGLAQANSRRSKRQSVAQPAQAPSRVMPSPPPPPSRVMPAQPPPVPRAKGASQPPPTPGSRTPRRELPRPFDEKTRAVNDEELMAALRGAPGPGRVTYDEHAPGGVFDAPTRVAGSADMFDDDAMTRPGEGLPAKFLASTTEPSAPPEHLDEGHEDESTRLASVDSVAAVERGRRGGSRHDESTRAVDIRDQRAMSDVDWDID
jgi:hypothetical protein